MANLFRGVRSTVCVGDMCGLWGRGHDVRGSESTSKTLRRGSGESNCRRTKSGRYIQELHHGMVPG